ncbi:MAG: ribonuclease III [Methylacidiphilales bacterium]|nr:ribonuclease III [Candidatus Methylacidiphilales bacterium]
MNETAKLEEILGYHFRDEKLLRTALTHPSCGHELRQKLPDNQRLEFLGDAVLQLVLTRQLYRQLPNFDEGNLTSLRAAIVNRKTLESIANQFQLGQFLILGRGEILNHGRSKSSNLADAMEAIIGAIFVDGDFESSAAWLEPVLQSWIDEHKDKVELFNPKGALQECLQAMGKTTPEYVVESEEGPDHAKHYRVIVMSEGAELGRGSGSSKKTAEIEAAATALKKLKTS